MSSEDVVSKYITLIHLSSVHVMVGLHLFSTSERGGMSKPLHDLSKIDIMK